MSVHWAKMPESSYFDYNRWILTQLCHGNCSSVSFILLWFTPADNLQWHITHRKHLKPQNLFSIEPHTKLFIYQSSPNFGALCNNEREKEASFCVLNRETKKWNNAWGASVGLSRKIKRRRSQKGHFVERKHKMQPVWAKKRKETLPPPWMYGEWGKSVGNNLWPATLGQ